MPSTTLTPARRPRAAVAMKPDAAAAVLAPRSLAALAEVCALAPLPVLDDFTTDRARAALADAELLVTGWGCPPLALTLREFDLLTFFLRHPGRVFTREELMREV
ncbi:winged helix-turn-helix domain-containing protein, partial [Streptomyces sp. NPDC079189]|uniref:winged helix-turn-helix domain-containing protein n=1 Tax=Streptomyces sp. NPDC079189 TaxID=3154514 RepID=UPI00344743E6